MPLKIKLNKTQLVFVWAMGLLLGLEIISMVVLLYFARFAEFFSYFLSILQFLTPVFLAGYFVFLIVMLFSKGKEIAVKTWQTYLQESFRFFIVSFLIALIFMVCCTLFGALLMFLASQFYGVPTVHGTVEVLRHWVDEHFY